MKTIHFLAISLIGWLIMFALFFGESKVILEQPIQFYLLCSITGLSTGFGIGRLSLGLD